MFFIVAWGAVRRRSQVSWRPPSIAISSPTIKLESSVRRNRAKRATSSARIHTAADGSLHPSLPLSEIRRESPSGVSESHWLVRYKEKASKGNDVRLRNKLIR